MRGRVKTQRTSQMSPIRKGRDNRSREKPPSVDFCAVPIANNDEMWTVSSLRLASFIGLWWLWLPLAIFIRMLEVIDMFPWLLFSLDKAFDVIASIFGIEYFEYEIQDFLKLTRERTEFYNMEPASKHALPDTIK